MFLFKTTRPLTSKIKSDTFIIDLSPFLYPSPLGALKALGGFLEGDQGRTEQLPLYAK